MTDQADSNKPTENQSCCCSKSGKKPCWLVPILFLLMVGICMAGYVIRTRQLDAAETVAKKAIKDRGIVLVPGADPQHIAGIVFAGDHKQLNDEIVDEVADLWRLTSLNLDNTNITNKQLEKIGGLGSLISLLLSDTATTDKGLAHLTGLGNIESLHLCRIRITDAGLEHVKKLTTLKILDISGTDITDEGLKHLIELDNVEHLLLANTSVTDKGIALLPGMEKLKRLTLINTKVTPEAIANLKKAIPKLTVDEGSHKKSADRASAARAKTDEPEPGKEAPEKKE